MTLKLSTYTIAACITIFMAANLSHAGGWSSSGGGSGVACFADAGEAVKADPFIQAGKSLPQEVRSKIKTLVTLDYWEWEQRKPYSLHTFGEKKYTEIVTEVEATVAALAPVFIYKLDQAGDIIRFSDWQAKVDVPRVLDAKPAFPLPAQCRLVQLARRLSNNNGKGGEGPVARRPQVVVEFNQDLFAMLDALNQAILVVHEKMYLLGQAMGQCCPVNGYFFFLTLF